MMIMIRLYAIGRTDKKSSNMNHSYMKL